MYFRIEGVLHMNNNMSTDKKKMIVIKNQDGSSMNVELITYLISDDQINTYLAYSKGEISGADGDEIIYISKILQNGNDLFLQGIEDDKEWNNVQTLLKKIANA